VESLFDARKVLCMDDDALTRFDSHFFFLKNRHLGFSDDIVECTFMEQMPLNVYFRLESGLL